MNNAADLIIVPGIIALFFFGGVFSLACYAVTVRLRESKAAITRSAEWQRVFRRLQDANDRVITELETYPATYESLPQDVRDAIYAAHENARQLEGR